MKHSLFLSLFFCGLLATILQAVAEDSPAPTARETSVAAATVSRTLKDAGSNALSLAGPTTIAAIKSLGTEATSKQIAAIVYAAVRAVPDSALNVVRAAVSVAPDAAPQIAAAAARAVPNPWKEVRYQRGAQPPAPPQYATLTPPPPRYAAQPPGAREPDFKSPTDHATALQPVSDALPGVLDPAAAGDPMSIAEAIVQTAVDAHSGVDPTAVQQAVDIALYGDPGALFSAVGGSKGISGVGDAGNSNYANEPHDPGGNPPGTIGGAKLKKGPNNPNPNPVSP